MLGAVKEIVRDVPCPKELIICTKGGRRNRQREVERLAHGHIAGPIEQLEIEPNSSGSQPSALTTRLFLGYLSSAQLPPRPVA